MIQLLIQMHQCTSTIVMLISQSLFCHIVCTSSERQKPVVSSATFKSLNKKHHSALANSAAINPELMPDPELYCQRSTSYCIPVLSSPRLTCWLGQLATLLCSFKLWHPALLLQSRDTSHHNLTRPADDS